MRCKKHPLDLSSTAGVCASCLREKLIVLIAAQDRAQQAQLRSHGTTSSSSTGVDSHPPPLNFPRSVSPYISRRKSDHTTFVDQRFFSTPSVHPTANFANDVLNIVCKKKSSKFSKISKFFWPRFAKSESNIASSRDPVMNSPASSSSAWFSSVLTARRQTKSRFTTHDDRLRPCRPDDRGMSPERTSCDGEDCDRSSGYSSDASERWKQTPVTAPMSVSRRGKSNHGKNVAGFAFCLSPLVRASPSRNWNHHQKGGLPPDKGSSGEIRVPMKPHLSMAASFCANRSRKLADFGRFNNNR